MLGLFVSGSTN